MAASKECNKNDPKDDKIPALKTCMSKAEEVKRFAQQTDLIANDNHVSACVCPNCRGGGAKNVIWRVLNTLNILTYLKYQIKGYLQW